MLPRAMKLDFESRLGHIVDTNCVGLKSLKRNSSKFYILRAVHDGGVACSVLFSFPRNHRLPDQKRVVSAAKYFESRN